MATIKDIAQLAKVSPATVSRILNHDQSISVTPHTRQRVIEIAKELGYQKKLKIESKSLKTAFTVGIVQWYSLKQELEDPYYLSVRLGVEKYCNEQAVNVIRCFKSDNDLSSLNHIDGLICIGKFNQKEIQQFKEKCDNLIFIDLVSSRIRENSIVLDFKQAMLTILDYLTQLNHKTIGYLGGQEWESENQPFKDMRLETFKEYQNQKQWPIKLGAFTSESGYEMMKEWIVQGDLPSAIFAASDPLAIGALKALQEANIRVPQDISLIGFDDIQAASYCFPPLTTMSTPALEMGEYAARLIISKTLLGISVPMKIQLPCQLIIRQSCQERGVENES